jgi:hypothetical protein
MWRKVKETLHKADILTLISTGTLAILLRNINMEENNEKMYTRQKARNGRRKKIIANKEIH